MSSDQFEKAKHQGNSAASCEGKLKLNSLQYHFACASEEKVSPVKGKMFTRYEDRIGIVRAAKICRQPAVRCTAERPAPRSAIVSSKPWPGRKDATAHEVAEHASNCLPQHQQLRVDPPSLGALSPNRAFRHRHFPVVNAQFRKHESAIRPSRSRTVSSTSSLKEDGGMNTGSNVRTGSIPSCSVTFSPTCQEGMSNHGEGANEKEESVTSCTRSPVEFTNCASPSDYCPYVPFTSRLPLGEPGEMLDEINIQNESMLRNAVPRVDNDMKTSVPGKNSNCQRNDRKSSPGGRLNSGLSWMTRSSSSKASPSAKQQPGEVSPQDAFNADRPSSSRGRRSPLRRILDPLFKPRSRFPSPSQAASSVDGQSATLGTAHYHSPDKGLKLNYQSKGKSNNTSNSYDSSRKYLQHDNNRSNSSRHALLQLARKNGQPPLFMFSSGGPDILVATLRRKGISDNDDIECVYTIFAVQESEKKLGPWNKTGNKSKDNQLMSNAIAEIRVSCPISCHCCGSRNDKLIRQFVMVGAESLTTPCPDGPTDLQFGRELASIISTVGTSSPGLLCCSNQKSSRVGNSHCEQCIYGLNKLTLIALLPSGIHGSSTSSKPSSLMERWKSGVCDCGGWDEGCMLTVLTNSQLYRSSDQPGRDADGTQPIELFDQGRPQEDGHAFNMVSFKEGLYTVEFRASIALLQAFTVCISMLHTTLPDKLPNPAQVGTITPESKASAV